MKSATKLYLLFTFYLSLFVPFLVGETLLVGSYYIKTYALIYILSFLTFLTVAKTDNFKNFLIKELMILTALILTCSLIQDTTIRNYLRDLTIFQLTLSFLLFLTGCNKVALFNTNSIKHLDLHKGIQSVFDGLVKGEGAFVKIKIKPFIILIFLLLGALAILIGWFSFLLISWISLFFIILMFLEKSNKSATDFLFSVLISFTLIAFFVFSNLTLLKYSFFGSIVLLLLYYRVKNFFEKMSSYPLTTFLLYNNITIINCATFNYRPTLGIIYFQMLGFFILFYVLGEKLIKKLQGL